MNEFDQDEGELVTEYSADRNLATIQEKGYENSDDESRLQKLLEESDESEDDIAWVSGDNESQDEENEESGVITRFDIDSRENSLSEINEAGGTHRNYIAARTPSELSDGINLIQSFSRDDDNKRNNELSPPMKRNLSSSNLFYERESPNAINNQLCVDTQQSTDAAQRAGKGTISPEGDKNKPFPSIEISGKRQLSNCLVSSPANLLKFSKTHAGAKIPSDAYESDHRIDEISAVEKTVCVTKRGTADLTNPKISTCSVLDVDKKMLNNDDFRPKNSVDNIKNETCELFVGTLKSEADKNVSSEAGKIADRSHLGLYKFEEMNEQENIECMPNTTMDLKEEANITDSTSSSMEHHAFCSSSSSILHDTLTDLREEEGKTAKVLSAAARDTAAITEEMKLEVIELLEIFQLPYIIAPFEAEAQCAVLEEVHS